MSGTFPISRFLASLVVVSITYLLVGQTAAAGSTISAGFISYVDTSCNAAAIQNLALYINNSCYFSTKYVCNETSFTVYRCAGSADCSTNCVEESSSPVGVCDTASRAFYFCTAQTAEELMDSTRLLVADRTFIVKKAYPENTCNPDVAQPIRVVADAAYCFDQGNSVYSLVTCNATYELDYPCYDAECTNCSSIPSTTSPPNCTASNLNWDKGSCYSVPRFSPPVQAPQAAPTVAAPVAAPVASPVAAPVATPTAAPVTSPVTSVTPTAAPANAPVPAGATPTRGAGASDAAHWVATQSFVLLCIVILVINLVF